MKKDKVQRHWIKLWLRMIRLRLESTTNTKELINIDYNKISKEYDAHWTQYVHVLSEEMLHRLSVPKGASIVDLTCGTGFVTGKLAELSGGQVTGVDASKGMLEVARRNYGDTCTFVQSDVMTFLRNQPSESVEIITCAWGLGYFPPARVLREISRILQQGGRVGIIDHCRSSNVKIVRSTLQVFAEKPAILNHLMKAYYLPHSRALAMKMRHCHIHVVDNWDGAKTFYERDAKTTIQRLIKTGAAIGGLDFAMDVTQREKFYDRFAEIVQKRCGDEHGIPIQYRYLAAIGRK